MPYQSIYFSNGNEIKIGHNCRSEHGDLINNALADLPDDAQITNVQHAHAGEYGQYVSTLIIYWTENG